MTVTSRDEFPVHPAALACYSDALAEWGLWEEAADFGRRVESPSRLDLGTRLVLAWRLLRTGRTDLALSRLTGLPESAHPLVPALRSTALAVRDRSPESLAELLRVLSKRPPTRMGLRMVVLAARTAGDEDTAREAAARFLATVNADDPDMRRLLAPAQAIEGKTADAVSSAVYASAGRPADPEGPVREITEEIRNAGHGDVALRFLAEGYNRTGRRVYGELLAESLPWRVRFRNAIVGTGVAVTLVGIALCLGLGGPAGVGVLLAGVAFGLPLQLGGLLVRAPGSGFGQTYAIVRADAQYRSRSGRGSIVLPAVGSATGAFLWAMMIGRGERDSVPPPVFLGVAAAAVVVGAVAAAVAWQVRRRRRLAASEPEPLAGDRCRCWETDLLAGRYVSRYLVEHLEETATDEESGAVLRRCRTTDKTWLHLPARGLAAAVRLPDETEPEEPVGQYL
jgi:hypothetical protein